MGTPPLAAPAAGAGIAIRERAQSPYLRLARNANGPGRKRPGVAQRSATQLFDTRIISELTFTFLEERLGLGSSG